MGLEMCLTYTVDDTANIEEKFPLRNPTSRGTIECHRWHA